MMSTGPVLKSPENQILDALEAQYREKLPAFIREHANSWVLLTQGSDPRFFEQEFLAEKAGDAVGTAYFVGEVRAPAPSDFSGRTF